MGILRRWHGFRLAWLGLLIPGVLAACGPQAPACPEAGNGDHFLSDVEFAHALTATPPPYSAPVEVEIGRRKLVVDRVVSGPLCNDDWRGTVFVTCGARVAEWSDQPTFLKKCDLSIAPGSVVYVAAHRDAPYYQGCSCHTGEIAGK